jgi:hypothetical protein
MIKVGGQYTISGFKVKKMNPAYPIPNATSPFELNLDEAVRVVEDEFSDSETTETMTQAGEAVRVAADGAATGVPSSA